MAIMSKEKSTNRRCLLTITVVAALSVSTGYSPAHAAGESIIVQSTTSTQNSGLFDFLLPTFSKKTGVEVRVVAVGTGQAIKNARNGDGDVLLVHAKSAEEKFVGDGFGIERFDLMYNDFVIVGPASDPAGVNALREVLPALKKIAESNLHFASRGDDSGTHKKELRLWKEAGIDPTKSSGSWYRETGSGMGATLNAAVGMGAYTISDRATWIAFKNKGDFRIHVEGDDRLFNQYGVILVNPQKHPHVKVKPGQAFIDWLLSDEGQSTIAAYKVDSQRLFFPNAKPR
jgi:tungstate transport system substrate-binding protein